MDLLDWGIAAFLILANAVFVAAEFAAVSVPVGRVEFRADEGDVLAKMLLPFIRDPRSLDRYISVSQVGITASSLLLGSFGRENGFANGVAAMLQSTLDVAPERATWLATAIVLVLLTLVQMILGELLPKALALQYPTRAALWTVVPMRWFLGILRPVIGVLNRLVALILRPFGLHEPEGRHAHSPDEIEMLLAESREGGVLEAHEHTRLKQALHLGTRTARDLMVPRERIQAIDLRSSRQEILRAATESPFTRLPVIRDTLDDVLGLLHARDVALNVADPTTPLDLKTLLRPTLVVNGDVPADRLLARMRDSRRQVAVVTDPATNRTLGIVSVDDILDALLGEMADDLKDAAQRPVREGRRA